MQLQRVVFDKATKKSRKSLNPIEFYRTIYLDRFMYENKGVIDLGQGGLEKYKERIAKLREGLQKYLSFGEEKLDLRRALRSSIEFIRTQVKEEATLVDVYEGADVIYDPRGIGVIKDAKETASALKHSLTAVEQQVETMEHTLKEYTAAVEKVEAMKKYAYDLHTILMHSGGTDCGHYYAFIYDAGKKKWRKYNDEEVTEVSEDAVFKEAIGDGKSPATAYFLVYVAKGADVQEKSPSRDFALSASKLVHAGSREIINYYTTLLPLELKREVCEDNMRLDYDIMEKKSGWNCSQALDLYQKRYNKLMQNKKTKGYAEWNFIAYLEEYKYPQYRYCLLDSIISELNEGCIRLDVLEETDQLYQALADTFMKQCPNAPASLRLQDTEQNSVETCEAVFRKLITDRKMQYYIILKLRSSDWVPAFDAIEYFMGNNIFSEPTAKKVMEDIVRLMTLHFMSLVSKNFMFKEWSKAIYALKLITKRCAMFLDTEDPHVLHAKRYLTYVFKECGKLLEPKQLEEAQAELQNFGTVRPPGPRTGFINQVESVR